MRKPGVFSVETINDGTVLNADSIDFDAEFAGIDAEYEALVADFSLVTV